MKKITALFTLFTLTLGLVFVACQKETNTVTPVADQQVKSEEAGSRVVEGGCIPIGPFTFQIFGYAGCTSKFGGCTEPLFDFPAIQGLPLSGNQAMGGAHVDAEGYLVFSVDGSSLSQEFLQSIDQDRVFELSAPQMLPQPFIDQVYACSGLAAPVGPQVISAGTYPVEVDIDPAVAAAMPIPWWMFVDVDVEFKWKRNADGSEELIIKVHCC